MEIELSGFVAIALADTVVTALPLFAAIAQEMDVELARPETEMVIAGRVLAQALGSSQEMPSPRRIDLRK